jgi:dihydropteroate synthase
MPFTIRHRQTAPAELPLVMGVLNVTPDSFSDGGVNLTPEAALRAADEMVASGVDIIDVGPESTRPFSRDPRAAPSYCNLDRYAALRSSGGSTGRRRRHGE